MTLHRQIIDAIHAHDMNRPRSRQTWVGPSDIAQDCDHCLAAKLAGWVKRPEPAWLAYIGTAVHAQLQEAMVEATIDGFPEVDFAAEEFVTVGQVGGRNVDGHTDLWHRPSRTVVDFKTIGKTKLDMARRGTIPAAYRKQVHLYARGLGAHRVAILFLPRNELSLDKAVWWEEDFSPTLAYDTLTRADSIYFGLHGEAQLAPDDFTRAPGCYDCARYPDAPGPVSGTLESLIG